MGRKRWSHKSSFGRVIDGRPVRLYAIWTGMRARCFSPSQTRYHRYGGRGITICDEWSDYAVFRAWAIATGYRKELTIERINVDDNYKPSNCRWAPPSEQHLNRSTTRYLTLNGVTRSLMVWAEMLTFPTHVLHQRLRAGWSDERALTVPRRKRYPERPRQSDEKWMQ